MARPHWDQALYHGKVPDVHNIKCRLEELDFYAPRTARKPRLLKLLHRAECGFTSYDGLKAPELRRIAKLRGVTAASGKHTIKQKVIQLLETADERPFHVFFDRFANLPPELRVRIYELYFESLGALSCPSQPPISKVSRMLRMESLPMFYQTCRIKVKVDLRRAPFDEESRYVLQPQQLIRRFFDSLPENKLGSIQRLRLDTAIFLNGGTTGDTIWDIDLTRTSAIRIQSPLPLWRGHKIWNQAQIDMVEKRLKALVAEVSARSCGPKLRKEDMQIGHFGRFEKRLKHWLQVMGKDEWRELYREAVNRLLALGGLNVNGV
ncbi:hypothetical protein LTR37_002288 [Vermiconidia calcicola]|uniref:Uncharacterized protein n=1 Tax=Vermiconidia calcicola TaxID=1690605 RepID=A0ACC3NUX4_9PEZI|nr:hypothetical protein LTR37_002288 [Vermiconidia calcicola]